MESMKFKGRIQDLRTLARHRPMVHSLCLCFSLFLSQAPCDMRMYVVQVCPCMSENVHVCLRMSMCIFNEIYVHTYVYESMCVCMHVYVCVCMN